MTHRQKRKPKWRNENKTRISYMENLNEYIWGIKGVKEKSKKNKVLA